MGARGPLLVFFLSVLLWFFIHSHNSKQKKYIFLLLSMGGIAIIFKEKIFEMLSQLFPNSRTLLLLESGMFFDLSGRDAIYQNLLDNLQKNFILPHGLYSDRILLGNGHVDMSGYYAHNLFYEVLYQFGGIIGGGLILIFIILILISIREILYCRNEIFRIMYVTFFGGITMLFFSSSYLINERFWLIIGAIISSVFLMKNKASHIPRKSMNNRIEIQNKIRQK